MFAEIIESTSEALRAQGPMIYISGFGPASQFIEISEFRRDFPDAISLSQDQLTTRLLTGGVDASWFFSKLRVGL